MSTNRHNIKKQHQESIFLLRQHRTKKAFLTFYEFAMLEPTALNSLPQFVLFDRKIFVSLGIHASPPLFASHVVLDLSLPSLHQKHRPSAIGCCPSACRCFSPWIATIKVQSCALYGGVFALSSHRCILCQLWTGVPIFSNESKNNDCQHIERNKERRTGKKMRKRGKPKKKRTKKAFLTHD